MKMLIIPWSHMETFLRLRDRGRRFRRTWWIFLTIFRYGIRVDRGILLHLSEILF